MQKNISKNKYRPEIDGLRAFAVATVIINHFNKDILPGGYLGVDIFFVISGFVITSSLYKRQSKDFKHFIISFYERRIKRLVPALSVFVLITSIAICLFNPIPVLSLKTGLTSLFGLSNLYILKQSTDYFAQITELNVFAHTWSLGVEEQFYILFPFLIWFSGFGRQTKNGARNLFFIIGALTISSLIGFLYLYPINQSGAYFLMPTRFWEIASGCLLYIVLEKRKSIEQSFQKVPSLLIIAMIIGVMYLPMSWATASTVAMVTLSSLLIISIKKETIAFNIFSNPKVVYIGLISYSLYLWHWCVLSISRWTIGIHWWSVPFQVLLLIGLANASYSWIEKPLRNSKWFKNQWETFAIGGGVIISLSGFLVVLEKPLIGKLYSGDNSKDYDNKITNPIDFVGKFTNRIAKNCHSSDSQNAYALKNLSKINNKFINDCLSMKSNKPIIAFGGDSHSQSNFPISEVFASTGLYDVFSHSRDGCAFPPQGQTKRKNCFQVQTSFSKYVQGEIKSRLPGSVVIANSFLTSHFGYNGNHRKQIKKYSDGSRESVDKNLKEYVMSAKKFANQIQDVKASLIIFAPLPNHPGFTPAICSKQWFRPSPPIICNKTEKGFLQRERKHILEAITNLEKQVSNIYVFDPFEKFCDIKYCYIKKNNKFLYSDDNHLSVEGAIMISKDLLSLIRNINSTTNN